MARLKDTAGGALCIGDILRLPENYDLGPGSVDPRHMELNDRMVDALDRRGRKNGKGFYDYPPKPAKKSLWPGLKDFYPQKQADDVDIEEMKQRFLVTIALEAARTVDEGIVIDPREADVGSILGFGFAPYTGGTLSYIDGMGAATFVALCDRLGRRLVSLVRSLDRSDVAL